MLGRNLSRKHVFVMAGADPSSRWLNDCVALDTKGFIQTRAELLHQDLNEGVDVPQNWTKANSGVEGPEAAQGTTPPRSPARFRSPCMWTVP